MNKLKQLLQLVINLSKWVINIPSRISQLTKRIKPIFVEDSWVPAFLSRFAPLNIGAVTIVFLVFSRGKMNEETKRHETIHVQQTLELLVVGMLFLYLYDYSKGFFMYKNDWEGQKNQRGWEYSSGGNKAYHNIRAEQEAYAEESNENYLEGRKRYQYLWNYKV